MDESVYVREHYYPGCLFDCILRMLRAWCRWDQPEGVRAVIHMSMMCHDELRGFTHQCSSRIKSVLASLPYVCWPLFGAWQHGMLVIALLEGHLSFVWTF